MIAETLLVVSLATLAYAWVGYPLVIGALAQGKRRKPTDLRGASGPASVAILFSAYNEEKCIGARIENLLVVGEQKTGFRIQDSAVSSPSSVVRRPLRTTSIHIGIDGSTDRTAEIASGYANKQPCIHVHEFKERRGKAAVLKYLVAAAGDGSAFAKATAGKPQTTNDQQPTTNILVFTDANTQFRDDALDKLLAPFSDERVGGVCGRLVLGGKASEGFYWRWENRLKEWESALDSCLGANGAIYAIRSELFWHDIPDNTIVDDFVIGMKVREKGYKMLYEPSAVAEEELPETKDEWKRRVRIGAGDFQALVFCRSCLLPKYGKFAWMFFSHKVLRWFTPHLLLLVACLAVVPQARDEGGLVVGWPLSVLFLGLVLLAFALLGRLLRNADSPIARFLRLFDHFVTMQAAIFAGFLRFCRGGLTGTWERTERTEDRGQRTEDGGQRTEDG